MLERDESIKRLKSLLEKINEYDEACRDFENADNNCIRQEDFR